MKKKHVLQAKLSATSARKHCLWQCRGTIDLVNLYDLCNLVALPYPEDEEKHGLFGSGRFAVGNGGS